MIEEYVTLSETVVVGVVHQFCETEQRERESRKKTIFLCMAMIEMTECPRDENSNNLTHTFKIEHFGRDSKILKKNMKQ